MKITFASSKILLSKLFPLLIILLVSGCTFERCENLLKADFSSATPGADPDLTLAGDPVGDQIWYSRERGPELKISSDKQLNYKSVYDSWPQYLGFYPKSVIIDRPIYYYWNATPSISGVPLIVFFGDGHFGAFGGIKYDTDGKVKIRASATDDDYVNLGSYTNGSAHTIWIRYDPSARSYRVKITPASGEAIDSGERPLIGTVPTESTYPAIYFRYPGEEDRYKGAQDSQYKIKFIYVNKKEPK
ncbi:hypothetical protein [Dyadobacter frigoris]|uniref:Uncharacterized protein n=1 Tax=Dyadobacter frigoris TaxID=2576211 RepID=A0A4U6CV39_9BACT|nr:hypothetical protein [Dyadobacter frigoris]TKT88522.1 hypothetical protein FDK13_26590 [Dyadobacter frigoris]GLU54568.1 hypothetical protein Dfri01_40290 [Dyadobacter frigoris]